MKKSSKINRVTRFGWLAFTFCALQFRSEASVSYALKPVIPLKGVAKVVRASGLPTYSYDGILWQTIVDGQELRPGARVRGESGSSTMIFLKDQASFLKLGDSVEWLLASNADEPASPVAPAVRVTPQGFRVRAVRGLAETQETNGEWRLIRVNEVIPGGKMVRTDSKSILDLYNRKSALFMRVGPKSLLQLTSQTNSAGLQASLFRLESGSVQARAQDIKTLAIKD